MIKQGQQMWSEFLYYKAFALLYQGRMAPIPTQRPLEVSPAERAAPIRHVPTRLWRCWVACWWCCVCPPPGSVPPRWWSWPSSRSLAPSSSPGSAATGTSCSSPSTTPGMLSSHGRNRRPFRNSGKLQRVKNPMIFHYFSKSCFWAVHFKQFFDALTTRAVEKTILLH